MASVPSRLVVLASVPGLHQAQHRSEQDAQHHQHQYVGDASQSEDAVGEKGHHQQTADQSQNQCGRHDCSVVVNEAR